MSGWVFVFPTFTFHIDLSRLVFARRQYKYFRRRLWSVRSWISIADSWVEKPLYSLMVCLWGRAPSSFRVNTPIVCSRSGVHSAWFRFQPSLIMADFSLLMPVRVKIACLSKSRQVRANTGGKCDNQDSNRQPNEGMKSELSCLFGGFVFRLRNALIGSLSSVSKSSSLRNYILFSPFSFSFFASSLFPSRFDYAQLLTTDCTHPLLPFFSPHAWT